MARIKDKSEAVRLRKLGMSYSQIKARLGISKGTLSGWLYNMPLSEDRIRELGPLSQKRIERCRNTKLKNRQKRLANVYEKVSKNIGKLNERDLFVAGFFLYWAEGGKTKRYTTTFSNTDPQMIKFFLQWVATFFDLKGIKMKVLLHLYEDMNIKNYTNYWSKELNLGLEQFSKPYIKKSTLAGLSYKNGFGKGTCNIRIDNRDMAEYILQGLEYIRKLPF
jgi:hypothetical protein